MLQVICPGEEYRGLGELQLKVRQNIISNVQFFRMNNNFYELALHYLYISVFKFSDGFPYILFHSSRQQGRSIEFQSGGACSLRSEISSGKNSETCYFLKKVEEAVPPGFDAPGQFIALRIYGPTPPMIAMVFVFTLILE